VLSHEPGYFILRRHKVPLSLCVFAVECKSWVERLKEVEPLVSFRVLLCGLGELCGETQGLG